MNLHDQYETLLRRGMPASPFVETSFSNNVEGDIYDKVADYMWREFVRDHLTMHTLRWFKDHGGAAMLQNGQWSLCIGGPSLPNPYDKSANLLEAILAATEHLEPK